MNKVDYTYGSGHDSGAVYDKRWWKAPKSERALAIAGIVKLIAQYDSKRQTQYQVSSRLYGGSSMIGVNGLNFSKISAVQSTNKERVSYNIIQSGIDTVVAKMGKNKPKALFLTSGGDWRLQRKAKKLDKFVEGIFYENAAYELGLDCLRDGAVIGDGFIHVFDHYGRVKYERADASELYVDWVEAYYGFPRQLHRVKNVDREVLADMFPGKRGVIMAANSASADMTGQYQNVSDQITVVESWHLPSGPEAGDGLHTINTETENLFEEKWEKDFFPFARFQWGKRRFGFWGQGGAEQIQSLQLEANKILWIIQRSFHLAGSFKVLLEHGSKIVKEHLNNDIGAIVSYTGTAPQYVIPPVVPPEYYQHLATLKNAAFEQLGISQLSAASVKPAGLNSGKALREYNDIETERFMTIGQAYENLYLDLAKLSISVAKDIYSEKGEYEVQVPGKKFIQTIDWSEIDLEDDEYFMKVFPVSSLPNDPSGRLQTIQEYIQAGFISQRTGQKLLDFPDLEQVEDLKVAEEDYANKILEQMIEDDVYTPPEPYDDLGLMSELALEYYAQGKLNNLEEEKLDLLRRFIDQVNLLKQKAMPPAPVGAPGEPPNPAVPLPQSDLVPNMPTPGGAGSQPPLQ